MLAKPFSVFLDLNKSLMRAPIRAETSDYVKLSFYQPWTLKPITNINIYLQLNFNLRFINFENFTSTMLLSSQDQARILSIDNLNQWSCQSVPGSRVDLNSLSFGCALL